MSMLAHIFLSKDSVNCWVMKIFAWVSFVGSKDTIIGPSLFQLLNFYIFENSIYWSGYKTDTISS